MTNNTSICLENELDVLRNEISTIKNETRIKAMNPNENYDSFSLMKDLTQAVEKMVEVTYNIEKNKIFGDNNVSNFGIFLYGSPSRNEMTTYSDIDLIIIDENKSQNTKLLKQNIINSLSTFGFGKIDDPNWEQLEIAEKYAQKSITEGNQIIDSKFICGDIKINSQMNLIKQKYDTLERNVRNMFFQWFYLDFYYSHRSTPEIPNVKYCKGGYRELLTFDWFDKLFNLYRNNKFEINEDLPYIKVAITNLLENEFIKEDKFDNLYEAIDFITLLRNEILHINQNTSDKGITHLDENTRNRLLELNRNFFLSYNIIKPKDILNKFNESGNIIREIKEMMFFKILNFEEKNRLNNWKKYLYEILNPNTSIERRKQLSDIDDDLLNIASVWGANYIQDKNLFEYISENYIKKNQYEVIASIACSPLSSDKILHKIVTDYAKNRGLEYILRIIGRNPNTSKETLISIVNDDSLDKHYKIVAKLRIEKGLEHATKRAS